MAPWMEGRFDAFIVGRNGCHISPRARRVAFMKSLPAQLRPGSAILVSTAIRAPNAKVLKWTAHSGIPVFEAAGSGINGGRLLDHHLSICGADIAKS